MDSLTRLARRERAAPTFADIVARHAAEWPDAIALRYRGQTTSYAQLDRLSNRIAHFLLARCRRGDRIAYLGENSDIAVALTIGIAKAAMVLVPIIGRLASDDIAYIVADSGAKLLFVDGELAPLAAALPAISPAIVQIDGAAAVKGWANLAEWLPNCVAEDVDEAIGVDDILLQIYISEPMGRPKETMLTHANVMRYWQVVDASGTEWLKVAPGGTALLTMPFGHFAGIGQALFILLSGEEMIIHREFDAGAILDAIEAHRPKRLFLVPAALQMLLAHPRAETTDFSSLRLFSHGAGPIPVPLLEAAMARLGCQFCQIYGMIDSEGDIAPG